MSTSENPMGEPPVAGGRRPVAHYIGLAVVVIVVVVIVVAVL